METSKSYKEPLAEGHIGHFTSFCRNNRASIAIILVMLFLTYGFMLFHFSFSIDTEDIIVKQMFFYDGWLGINRYGLVITKQLAGLLSVIPGFATMLMIVMTFGYSLVWMYFFHWIKGQNSGRTELSWVFPVLFFSSIPMIEQVNFQCQSFEIAFAMMLCAAALLLEWQWILSGGIIRLLFSVLLGTWCFASYQAFVPLYISASMASFVLGYYYRNEEIESHVFLISIKLTAVFLCDYVIYTLLGKLLLFLRDIPAGAYTGNMIHWGKYPLEEIISSLKIYMGDVIFARNIFWNHGYLLVAFGLLLTAFWRICRKTAERRFYLFYILVIFLLLASPFFLPVLMGSPPVARGQFALPFVIAAGAQIIAERFLENTEKLSEHFSFIRIAVSVFLLLLVFRSNIVTGNRLFYSDYVVHQQENVLTERLIEKVTEAGGSQESTVAILGHWSPSRNPSMTRGETLGYSFYEWDQPIPRGTCKRILNYWSALGYTYQKPDEEQWKMAETLGKGMPIWPQQGSVIREGDLVVIRLSE